MGGGKMGDELNRKMGSSNEPSYFISSFLLCEENVHRSESNLLQNAKHLIILINLKTDKILGNRKKLGKAKKIKKIEKI